MSVLPGFSVSDLISAVDWTIVFIIALKSVRGEVKDLKKSLERAGGQLKGLEELLKERENRVEGPVEFRTAALNTLRTDLHEILNDIFSLLNQFDPQGASKSVPFRNFRQNVKWVVDSRYSGSVKGLLERLSEYRESVQTELLLCIHHHQVSNEPRKGSIAHAPIPAPLPVTLSSFDKETGGSSSSRVADASTTAAKRPVISSPTPLPLTIQNQQGPWRPVNGPPSPPPSPPVPPLLTRSQTSSTVNTIYAPAIQAPPVQIRQASTLPYAPPQLIPEILRTTGAVRVWFQYEDPKDSDKVLSVPHHIKTVAIFRDGSGCFRGIHSTRFDDAILEHELPNDKYFLNYFNHPLPVHTRQARDLKEGRFQAKNCVSFLRDDKDPAAVIPDYYSFSDVEDYRLFQSKIVRRNLVVWYEIKSISTKWSPTPVCENQILQLWGSELVRTIQFFRNGKDRQYSQHFVSSLRIDEKSLKKAHKEGLKIFFVRSNGSPPLSPVEQKMEYLSIIFTNPKEINSFLKEVRFS